VQLIAEERLALARFSAEELLALLKAYRDGMAGDDVELGRQAGRRHARPPRRMTARTEGNSRLD
jgi:hypothetical protein